LLALDGYAVGYNELSFARRLVYDDDAAAVVVVCVLDDDAAGMFSIGEHGGGVVLLLLVLFNLQPQIGPQTTTLSLTSFAVVLMGAATGGGEDLGCVSDMSLLLLLLLLCVEVCALIYVSV